VSKTIAKPDRVTTREEGSLLAAEAPGPASYTVLARRYRSRSFDELVGQEPITRTLRQAIESGRTAHAYLFCGTRGVGKTSMARVFAKALNVSRDLREADRIADAILRGDDLDVIEIDAASNRGIDNARDLIANAVISPARCRYKIYIIDEVHGLTKDAFNALLKIMEEPPSHVKFILCTTEPNRVPPTIQSRCQRFDFRALPTRQIAAHLKDILDREGVTADAGAIQFIAQLGRGSMRDALSILDRVLASGDGDVDPARIREMLGLPDEAVVLRWFGAIASGNTADALEHGAELLARGVTVEQALETLAEHLRNVLVAATCGVNSPLLEVTEESRASIEEHGARFDPATIVFMMAVCDAAARNAKQSSVARAIFDAAIVRLCLSDRLASVAQLLSGTAVAPATRGGEPEKKNIRGAPPAVDRNDASGHLTELKPAASLQTKPSPANSSGPPLHDVDGAELWRRLIEQAASSPADQARLSLLRFVSFDGRTLAVDTDSDRDPSQSWIRSQPGWLAGLVRRIIARDVRVQFVASSAPIQSASRESLVDEARRLPIVAFATELLEATVVRVDATSAPVASQGDGDV
jgi:DNA polymerase-3 subunit gamma/tau